MKQIPLTQSKVALVDDGVFDELSRYKWHIHKIHNLYYAYRSVVNGPRKHTVLMHRHILGLQKGDGKQVDHINHVGTDNRRCNLRLCTYIQNQQNSSARKGCTSKYKGVYWNKGSNKWMARIKLNGKLIYLGIYRDEAIAARAYDRHAIKLFGEFANLNLPLKESSHVS